MILFVAVGNAGAVAAATIAVHFLHRCYQFQWNFLCIWFHDCIHSFPIPILIFLSFRFELYFFFVHSVFIFFFCALHSIQKIICHKYSKIIMHKGARTERCIYELFWEEKKYICGKKRGEDEERSSKVVNEESKCEKCANKKIRTSYEKCRRQKWVRMLRKWKALLASLTRSAKAQPSTTNILYIWWWK